MHNDTVIYKRYFGAFNDTTVRPIASGTKMASMATIMTLRQLMSHTSGLEAKSPYEGDASLTLAQAVDRIGLKTTMSDFAPGAAFIYGELSMHVAGGALIIGTPYAEEPLNKNMRYGFGTWLDRINPNNNTPVLVSSQGAFGFSPWIDRCRNLSAVFFVRKTRPEIQPTHLALRALVERIIPLSLPIPTITLRFRRLHSSSATGNQWFLDGKPLPEATEQVFNPVRSGDYTVRVTDACGCDATSMAYPHANTGIRDVMKSGKFPLPVREGFDLKGRKNGNRKSTGIN